MRKNIIVCLIAGTMAALSAGCGGGAADSHDHHGHESHAHDPADHEHHHDHNHNPAHEHGEKPAADDSDEITLSPAMAERMGVMTEVVQPGEFHEVIKATGRLMDAPDGASVVSAPIAGVVTFARGINPGSAVSRGTTVATINPGAVAGGNPNSVAKAALDAAKRELDRLEPLYKERIVTASEYNAAKRAYEEARAGYSGAAASGRAVAATSGTITSMLVSQGQYVAAGEPIATVSGAKSLVLQVDVPERYYSSVSSVSDAHIQLPYSSQMLTISDAGGKKITAPAMVTSVKPGYIPVYFSLANDGSLLPGAAVDVYLLCNAVSDVLSVPVGALSEQQGKMFVFVKLDDECYTKVPVETGASDGRRVRVTSGLHGGETVVVEGAVTVRLAESSGVVPEGHSHNH